MPASRPVGEAIPVDEVVTADRQRHDAVERAGEPFEFSGRLLEDGREAAEPDPGAAGAHVREQRFVQIDDRSGDVVAGLQRTERQRVGSRIECAHVATPVLARVRLHRSVSFTAAIGVHTA